MIESKYKDLIYEFEPLYTSWGDWCHNPQAYFRGNTNIPGSNLYCGYKVIEKPVYLEREPHFHREEEYLVFMGIQRPDVFVWDAEIELWMGEDPDHMEKHIIDRPSIVRIPKGMWHCPLDFKRIDKPIFFQAALMNGDFGCIKRRVRPDGSKYYEYTGDEARFCVYEPAKKCNYCGKCFANMTAKAAASPVKPADWRDSHEPEQGHKYDELFWPIKREDTHWGDWCASPRAYFRGIDSMPGANWHCGFAMFTGPAPMEEAHFHQGVDEYLVFLGADFNNMFDVDMEIEVWMGEHPDHMEKITITKPTIIRVPPTMWHCPINFKRIDKPIMFQASFLSGVWGTIGRRKNEDGTVEYPYRGLNTNYCREHPEQRCHYCGKCFAKKPGEDKVIDVYKRGGEAANK